MTLWKKDSTTLGKSKNYQVNLDIRGGERRWRQQEQGYGYKIEETWGREQSFEKAIGRKSIS